MYLHTLMIIILFTICTIVMYKSKSYFSYHSSWSWYLGVVLDPNSRAVRMCRNSSLSTLTCVCEWKEKPLCLSSHSNTYILVLPVFVQAALWQSAHSAILAIKCCFPSC